MEHFAGLDVSVLRLWQSGNMTAGHGLGDRNMAPEPFRAARQKMRRDRRCPLWVIRNLAG
jgi:hypothetical protein